MDVNENDLNNPENEKENECGYCGEPSHEYFCSNYCRKGYVYDLNED
jgi:hypothetical protein